MYYFISGILVVLALVLLIWAIKDIIKSKKNKSLILYLLLTPIVGPLIYFQTK